MDTRPLHCERGDSRKTYCGRDTRTVNAQCWEEGFLSAYTMSRFAVNPITLKRDEQVFCEHCLKAVVGKGA